MIELTEKQFEELKLSVKIEMGKILSNIFNEIKLGKPDEIPMKEIINPLWDRNWDWHLSYSAKQCILSLFKTFQYSEIPIKDERVNEARRTHHVDDIQALLRILEKRGYIKCNLDKIHMKSFMFLRTFKEFWS